MKSKYIIISLLFAFLLMAGMANAQERKTSFDRYSEIMTGAYFQKWSADNDRSVSEWVLPVTYLMPLGDKLTFNVMNAPTMASSSFTEDKLNGIIDTRVNVSYLLTEALMFSSGVSLPTGNSSFEGDQSILSAFLADDALGFRVPTLGQGLDVKANLAFAKDMGGFVLGGGFGYMMKGKFKPFDGNDLEYKPGDEMTVTLGADKNLEIGGNPAKILADVTYTFYGKDEADGDEIFKSGNRLRIELQSYFKLNPLDVLLFARNRTKGKNERGLRSLTSESLNSNGNRLEIGTISSLPMSPAFRLKLLLDTKIYSKNEYEQNGAFVMGFGTGFQYKFSEKLLVDSHFKYLTGSLKNGDASASISGFEVGGIFRFTL